MTENSFAWKNIVCICVIAILFIYSIGITVYALNSYKKTEILESVVLADLSFGEIEPVKSKAGNYYELASLAYERSDFGLVENNCKHARQYYSKHSQGLKKIKAEMNDGVKHEVIDIYTKVIEEYITIDNSLYEACEYFEAAARSFDVYYNTDVLYSDPSYDFGVSQIEMMNEKIRQHDKAVERYNNLLEELKLEIEKVI